MVTHPASQLAITSDTQVAYRVIPFAALAKGTSKVRIPAVAEHVAARLWLVEKILGAKRRIRENLVTIEGIVAK